MNTEFQDLPNVVSPKEVQTYFGISRSTTYRIFHDATFPAFHIGNRLLVRRATARLYADGCCPRCAHGAGMF